MDDWTSTCGTTSHTEECVCVFTGWSHCSQVKVTVNKRDTKPERRRHLTVCECEKNRDRKGEEDKEKKNTNKLISCLF